MSFWTASRASTLLATDGWWLVDFGNNRVFYGSSASRVRCVNGGNP